MTTRFDEFIPKFNGEDVEGWLYKCEQFFLIDETPERYKVRYVVFHLEGRALQWHQEFMKSNGKRISDVSWDDYTRNASTRFAATLIEDAMGTLKTLNQTGELQDSFDHSCDSKCVPKLFDELPERVCNEIEVQPIGKIKNRVDILGSTEESITYKRDNNTFENEMVSVNQDWSIKVVDEIAKKNDNEENMAVENFEALKATGVSFGIPHKAVSGTRLKAAVAAEWVSSAAMAARFVSEMVAVAQLGSGAATGLSAVITAQSVSAFPVADNQRTMGQDGVVQTFDTFD